MNIVYFKYIGVRQGKHLFELWKALDRSDLKKVLVPHKDEQHLRAQALQVLGVRDCKMMEVKE
jgi:hypothetical protein